MPGVKFSLPTILRGPSQGVPPACLPTFPHSLPITSTCHPDMFPSSCLSSEGSLQGKEHNDLPLPGNHRKGNGGGAGLGECLPRPLLPGVPGQGGCQLSTSPELTLLRPRRRRLHLKGFSWKTPSMSLSAMCTESPVCLCPLNSRREQPRPGLHCSTHCTQPGPTAQGTQC